MKYQLVDAKTSDMVGFFDDYSEVVEVLRFDLKQNGPDSVRSLVLISGSDSGPAESVDGEHLLEIARSRYPVAHS
ncbi:hypothetical protein BH09CHL1_BH09CHL1_09260 [soil metagenome]